METYGIQDIFFIPSIAIQMRLIIRANIFIPENKMLSSVGQAKALLRVAGLQFYPIPLWCWGWWAAAAAAGVRNAY